MTTRPDAVQVPWPGSGSLADTIPDGWYTISRAAKAVGRTKDTLKRWSNDGTYEPSGYTVRGKLTVWLYSDNDISNMIEIAHGKKPGRPPKEKYEPTSS